MRVVVDDGKERDSANDMGSDSPGHFGNGSPQRKRVHPRPRPILDGIIFRTRSGCQWNRLPRELGDDSTIHRTFQRWVQSGVLESIWAVWTGNG